MIDPEEFPSGQMGDTGRPQLGQLWSTLVRRRWLILGAVACSVAATAFFTYRQTPIYQASSLLRVDDKQPNLPEIFRSLTRGSEISTEIEVLSSRALVEDVILRIGTRLQVIVPKGAMPSQLMSQAEIAPRAPERSYRLLRSGRGGHTVSDALTGAQIAVARPGIPVSLDGVKLTLRPEALEHDEILIHLLDPVSAVDAVHEALSVTQPTRDANIVRIQYEGDDPETVRRVANMIASRYIERRQDAFKADARRSAQFLREQLDRVGQQLAAVEDTFQRFRERAQVIDPNTEASGQVARLINKEAERSSLEAERQAFARSLEELTRAAGQRPAGAPSPYRQLLSFPTLLRSQAAIQLLNTLATVENERTTLLTRRTERDPDVMRLTDRIEELEDQLRSIAVTYLSGLTNQVSALDTALGSFNRRLGGIPRKQVQYARLQRRSKGLEETYNLLQTRLKESEIAQAIEDPSVQIVDSALTPQWPARPNPKVNLLGGVLVGLMLGVGGALLREQLDRSVHNRRDVISATGLPVMGLIPHVRRSGKHLALIAEKRSISDPRIPPAAPTSLRRPPSDRRPAYTFLQVDDDHEDVPAEAQQMSTVGRPASRPLLRLMLSGSGTPAAEAYGMLQTNLAFARRDVDVRTVVLTSPLSGEGKSTCAVNLALTLAFRGLRTLLIDADMRRGVVHTAFDVPREPGLSDVLRQTIGIDEALRHAEVGQQGAVVHFLTAGTLAESPSGLLDSTEMRFLLQQLAERFDRIIIDSPPVNIVTDAALLGALVQGVLVVARAGLTEGAALAYAIEQLRHVGAPVLGVVLNDIDFRRDAGYDRAYKYYNHNEYVDQPTGS